MRNQDNQIEPRHQEGEIRKSSDLQDEKDFKEFLKALLLHSSIIEAEKKEWTVTLVLPKGDIKAPYIL